MSQVSTTPPGFRVRASSRSTKDKDKEKVKQSPKAEVVNGKSPISPAKKASPKSDVKKVDDSVSRVRTKPKSGTGQQLLPPPSGGVAVVRSANRPVLVEQFAKPRRQHRPVVVPGTATGGRNEGENNNNNNNNSCVKELQQKLELNEALVEDLQSQILALKVELDKVHALNKVLQSQNHRLSQDLAAAAAATCSHQESSIEEYQRPNFKDIQRLIANKLDISQSKVRNEAINGPSTVRTFQAPRPPPPSQSIHICSSSPAAALERKVPSLPSVSLPPPPPPPVASVSPAPPPPPPPLRPLAKAASAPKAQGVVQFYHALRKQEERKDIAGPGNRCSPAAMSVHSSIVGEIQNRSAHLLAIKADIETKGDFINGLIEKVLNTSYADIEDVLTFADWLDGQLSSLADESAVLKHFKWPERKADAIREAAVEYRGLKLLENEISSYKDDYSIPCGTALKKMAGLLDKSEGGIQRLGKVRNSVMRCYQDWKIPTDWMLDSGIVSKIKKASVNLAKMYMNRVKMELELTRSTDRESSQESLLRQGLHFVYRTHQFAGDLDSETLCAFEEIRQRVPGHLLGSRELFAAIPT